MIPANKTASNNFYFLVKECHISPLEIPHLTRFQVQTLIYQHNKQVEADKAALEEIEKKAQSNTPKRR